MEVRVLLIEGMTALALNPTIPAVGPGSVAHAVHRVLGVRAVGQIVEATVHRVAVEVASL